MSDKPTAIICDLDGTLAIHDGRGPFEYHKCDTDLVNEPILYALDALLTAQDHRGNPYYERVIFVSGREDSCREKTLWWLSAKCGFDGATLFMRKTADYRKDFVVKEEIYRQEIAPHYDVKLVLDDRDQVVEQWRALGLTCFQVAAGKF